MTNPAGEVPACSCQQIAPRRDGGSPQTGTNNYLSNSRVHTNMQGTVTVKLLVSVRPRRRRTLLILITRKMVPVEEGAQVERRTGGGNRWVWIGVFSESKFFVVLSVLYLHPSIFCCCYCSMPPMLYVSYSCAFPPTCFFFFVPRLDVSGFGTTLTTMTPI